MQTEFLRLFEVVTNMCDHVIEYIESDRAERRVMLQTLEQLGRVISEGAAAVVAANAARPLDPPAGASIGEPIEVPSPTPEIRERVIGGSMDAYPEPVIDLTGP